MLLRWSGHLLLASTESTLHFELTQRRTGAAANRSHLINEVAAIQDEFTRLAAISSIGSFATQASKDLTSPPTESVFLSVYLSLYNALNDDDEDVRTEGARVASMLLSEPFLSNEESRKKTCLSHPAARTRLRQWLLENYRSNAVLSFIVLARSAGAFEDSDVAGLMNRMDRGFSGCTIHEMSVDKLKLLQHVSAFREGGQSPSCETSVLFEKEKENLYVDVR